MRLKIENQGLAGADVHTSIDAVARRPVGAPRPARRRRGRRHRDDHVLRHRRLHRPGRGPRRRAPGWRSSAPTTPSSASRCRPTAAARSRTAATASWSSSPTPAPPSTAPSPSRRRSSPREIRHLADKRDLPTGRPADQPIQVHIGLHTGRPAQDEGNFYGTDVNLAARIADHVAQAGQIVVSQRLRDALAASRPRLRRPVEVELKGLSGKHRVFEVLWARLRTRAGP